MDLSNRSKEFPGDQAGAGAGVPRRLHLPQGREKPSSLGASRPCGAHTKMASEPGFLFWDSQSRSKVYLG